MVWLALAVLTFAGGCTRSAEDDLLARVGDREIRTADLRAEAERHNLSDPDPETKKRLLDSLVTRQCLVLQARHLGLHQDPQIQWALENVLISKLKERQLTPRLDAIEVTADDVRSVRAEQPTAPSPQTQSRLAILHLVASPLMSQEKRARLVSRMEEARQKVLEASSPEQGFGSLAMDYSEDQASRYRGGDIGWFDHQPEKYRWNPILLTAGFDLAHPGDVSEVISTSNGLYLVRLMDRRKIDATEARENDSLVIHRLYLEKRKQLEEQFLQHAREQTAIQLFPERLRNLQLNHRSPPDFPLPRE